MLYEQTTKGFREEYDFLSNMYPVDIMFAGIKMHSSEHIYQYLKAVHLKDEDLKHKVLFSKNGYEAKKLMKGLVVPDHVRVYLMGIALDKKYDIPEMANRLLLTNDVELVEYNWWGDSFWGKAIPKGGTCLTATGKNILGNMLMAKRQQLRDDRGIKD